MAGRRAFSATLLSDMAVSRDTDDSAAAAVAEVLRVLNCEAQNLAQNFNLNQMMAMMTFIGAPALNQQNERRGSFNGS
jgi:hypothetical protein